jgi:hypothetical protein
VRAARVAAMLGCFGCGSTDEPILGRFEVIGSVTDGVVADGPSTAAPGVPGRTWARESWILERDRLVLEREVLVPAAGGGHVACEVAVKVQVAWTGAVLTVPYGATSRASASGGEPMSCEVSVAPGEWKIARLAGKAWDYELVSPTRTLRLVAGNENPDYGSRLSVPENSP